MLAKCARCDDDSNSESSSSLVPPSRRTDPAKLCDVCPNQRATRTRRGRSTRPRGQQRNKHVPYYLRLVLSSFANQSVRTLESLGSLYFHFPVVICTRPDNGHPPLSRHLTQHMFDTGKNLAARSRVTRILHLDRHCHVSFIVQSDPQLFLEQTG